MKKPVLVPDAKNWWKWYSTNLTALGLAMLSGWAVFPEDLKAYIPPVSLPFIAVGMFVLIVFGRVLDQPKLDKQPDKQGALDGHDP